MHAAVVTDTARPPAYAEFPEPEPADGLVTAQVLASAVHKVVKAIAAGKHYSSKTAPPFVPGLDGIVRLPDGRRVYAGGPVAPWGMLAERVAVRAGGIEVPEGVDDATAAAVVNPASSSWIPLTRYGPTGKTVLVLGATGTSGMLAVQAAKILGATRVVAVGRNPEALARTLELGADAVVSLADDLSTPLRDAADGYDLVLDYLWGQPVLAVLEALVANKVDPARPVSVVNIGSMAGPETGVPAALVRSSAISVSGHGIGSFPVQLMAPAVAGIFAATAAGQLTIDHVVRPLADAEAAWDVPERLVLVP